MKIGDQVYLYSLENGVPVITKGNVEEIKEKGCWIQLRRFPGQSAGKYFRLFGEFAPSKFALTILMKLGILTP